MPLARLDGGNKEQPVVPLVYAPFVHCALCACKRLDTGGGGGGGDLNVRAVACVCCDFRQTLTPET